MTCGEQLTGIRMHICIVYHLPCIWVYGRTRAAHFDLIIEANIFGIFEARAHGELQNCSMQ